MYGRTAYGRVAYGDAAQLVGTASGPSYSLFFGAVRGLFRGICRGIR